MKKIIILMVLLLIPIVYGIDYDCQSGCSNQVLNLNPGDKIILSQVTYLEADSVGSITINNLTKDVFSTYPSSLYNGAIVESYNFGENYLIDIDYGGNDLILKKNDAYIDKTDLIESTIEWYLLVEVPGVNPSVYIKAIPEFTVGINLRDYTFLSNKYSLVAYSPLSIINVGSNYTISCPIEFNPVTNTFVVNNNTYTIIDNQVTNVITSNGYNFTITNNPYNDVTTITSNDFYVNLTLSPTNNNYNYNNVELNESISIDIDYVNNVTTISYTTNSYDLNTFNDFYNNFTGIYYNNFDFYQLFNFTNNEEYFNSFYNDIRNNLTVMINNTEYSQYQNEFYLTVEYSHNQTNPISNYMNMSCLPSDVDVNLACNGSYNMDIPIVCGSQNLTCGEIVVDNGPAFSFDELDITKEQTYWILGIIVIIIIGVLYKMGKLDNLLNKRKLKSNSTPSMQEGGNEDVKEFEGEIE